VSALIRILLSLAVCAALAAPSARDAALAAPAVAQFKLANGGDLGVQVVGIETTPGVKPLLAPWHVVAGDPRRLAEPGAIVVDRSEYPKLKIDRVGHRAEVSGVRAEVVALTSGIRSFTTSPIVFTDIRTAHSYLPQLGGDAVTYVLVEVADKSQIAAVQARINALPHLAAYTRAEMSNRSRTAMRARSMGFRTISPSKPRSSG